MSKEDEEINNLRFAFYDQKRDIELPNEFLDDCLEIIENVDSYKLDNVNWKEREKMDNATRRSGNTLFDDNSDADTMKYLEADKSKGKSGKNIDRKEIKSSNEKEEALMSGLADIMGKLDEREKSNKEGNKNGL